MTDGTTHMPESERPLSEQYRIVAKQWVEADGAARLMEETKSAVLSQRKAALGDMPDSHAERVVKASESWMEFVRSMVEARTRANLLKVQLEYISMRHWERQSQEANARHELRLHR